MWVVEYMRKVHPEEKIVVLREGEIFYDGYAKDVKVDKLLDGIWDSMWVEYSEGEENENEPEADENRTVEVDEVPQVPRTGENSRIGYEEEGRADSCAEFVRMIQQDHNASYPELRRAKEALEERVRQVRERYATPEAPPKSTQQQSSPECCAQGRRVVTSLPCSPHQAEGRGCKGFSTLIPPLPQRRFVSSCPL